MKMIIDIPEEYKALFDTERCKSKFDSLATNEFGYVLRKAFENGTPLDDVKAEIFRQSKQNNENFSCDWNEGFNDGMFHTLTIIRECFKHISGKAESEDKECR